MAILWVLLGFLIIGIVMTVVGEVCGRGHLGAPQSLSHYIDEIEAMNQSPRG